MTRHVLPRQPGLPASPASSPTPDAFLQRGDVARQPHYRGRLDPPSPQLSYTWSAVRQHPSCSVPKPASWTRTSCPTSTHLVAGQPEGCCRTTVTTPSRPSAPRSSTSPRAVGEPGCVLPRQLGWPISYLGGQWTTARARASCCLAASWPYPLVQRHRLERGCELPPGQGQHRVLHPGRVQRLQLPDGHAGDENYTFKAVLPIKNGTEPT
jgi:hypothetical protein